LQTQRQAWKPFQQYNVVNIVVSIYLVGITICALYYIGVVGRANVKGIYAKAFTPCLKDDYMHSVVGGDTLAQTTTYDGLREQVVAAYGYVAHPVPLAIDGSMCDQNKIVSRSSNAHSMKAPARVTTQMRLVKPVEHPAHKRSNSGRPVVQTGRVNYTSNLAGYAFRSPLAVLPGFVNVFSYGQCTWWAAQRYFQLHSVAVPWRSHADAGQWVTRAYDNGWRVSSVAIIGSILVLQGGVQGAGAVGHVGIVENVRKDGTAIVSSMNWGYNRMSVSFALFRPGPGVMFVEQ
jgi:hypothetical protein